MQSLFERTVFRTASGGSEYEPHTFTMYLPQPSSDTEFGSVVFHEVMHWLQFICYTFGGFQSALIHARDEDAINILSKCGWLKNEHQRPQVRFSLPKSAKAFFNINFDHDYNLAHGFTEEDIWPYHIAWRDAFLCEHLFLQMSSFYEKGSKLASAMSSANEALQPELLIPRTLLRINNWAIDTLGYRSTEPRGLLEVTDIGNYLKLSNFGKAKHAGIELDTRDIIEGMSVALEIYGFHSDRMEEQAKERLKVIKRIPANAYYVRAIEIFLDIMGFPVKYDNDEEVAETTLNVARTALIFLAIAEMSLNPPLPPFGIINKLELDWNKIYPPLRFIELCHIAKRIVGGRGYILGGNTLTWIFEWITSVEALYLSQGGVFSYLIRDIDGYLPTEKSLPFLALIAEENSTMRWILRRKGVNTTGMAERFSEILKYCTGLELYTMLRRAHILFMNCFGTPRPFLIPFVKCESEKNCELSKPPLVIYKGGDFMFGWSERFAWYLIDYNIYHYPLHDIMLRQKPRLYLPGSPLISEERRVESWMYLQKTFAHVF